MGVISTSCVRVCPSRVATIRMENGRLSAAPGVYWRRPVVGSNLTSLPLEVPDTEADSTAAGPMSEVTRYSKVCPDHATAFGISPTLKAFIPLGRGTMDADSTAVVTSDPLSNGSSSALHIIVVLFVM